MDFTSIADAIAKIGFPIVAAIFLGVTLRDIAQWFMRAGDELKARFVLHVDQQDQELAKINPQLTALKETVEKSPQVCRFEAHAVNLSPAPQVNR